jgi:hypothetical protein
VKRLPLSALKFEATRKERVRDGLTYRSLQLHYFVEHGGPQTLVRIRLNDTQPVPKEAHPFVAELSPLKRQREPFWFYYQSVTQPMGNGEELSRRYPSIDLVVFSSVHVVIERNKPNLDKYQRVGFEGMHPDTMLPDETLSPARPKITMRRVHNLAQIPLLGTPCNVQQLMTDYSFYAFGEDKEHFVSQANLFQLLKTGKMSPEEGLKARHTWTRVFFSEQFTEFNFLESQFRLRVYDQHFDLVDGKAVSNDEEDFNSEAIKSLQDARAEWDTATKLDSLPKVFDYNLGFDSTSRLMSDERGNGYMVDHRASLEITKSPEVYLVGTIDRDVFTDQRTNAWLREALPAKNFSATNYKDFLPLVSVKDVRKGPLPIPNLEASEPAAGYRHEKNANRRLMEFEMSLVIGFTPFVGEAFGLYELYTALTEGKDAFGNHLTDTEKIIVGIAAIVPFVASTPMLNAFRGGKKLITQEAFPLLSRFVAERRAELEKLARLLEG